ncbi:hypothetical protein EPH95_12300 [Salicibibacter halophilus]|uniref:Uncharacterized protein n=1 Tax=Salicibibacter halophilus TaxID=2502791 RepID=A0A514LKS1_9BACI|nr:hypothetical protein [Salicibibacter halophilus]QDI91861.1 hypothetical protein EPH95_12300 [Salicibibacter halophilus]
MAKTPAEKRTSQDPAALILREEAWPFVRGKRSHGSDIPRMLIIRCKGLALSGHFSLHLSFYTSGETPCDRKNFFISANPVIHTIFERKHATMDNV